MSQVKKNMATLKAFNLTDLGKFIKFKIEEKSLSEVIFENKTLILTAEEDEHGEGELVVVLDEKETTDTSTSTHHELADLDVCTHEVRLTLTNGDNYGFKISSQLENPEGRRIFTFIYKNKNLLMLN